MIVVRMWKAQKASVLFQENNENILLHADQTQAITGMEILQEM